LIAPDRPLAILEFTVPGPPVPKGRPRTVRRARDGRPLPKPITFTPKRTTDYEAHVRTIAWAAVSHVPAWRTDAAYRVTATFYRAARRGDADNCIKSVLDSLQPLLFADDAQVIEQSARLEIDRERPRAEVRVEMVERPDWMAPKRVARRRVA